MTKPFSVDDLYLHKKITELDCAGAEALAACTVRSVDRDQDAYVSCIWAYALDGSFTRQLTHGPGHDKSPRWSPQGDRLAFLSDRGGRSQLYLLPRDGGEAIQVGDLGGAVSDLRWTPDGRSLVVAAAVDVDPDWRGARAHGRKAGERRPNAAEVAWKLPYKSDGMGYVLSREIHLFSVELATGEHEQLTDGAFDVLSHAVAPDGRHIAFVRTREGRFAHRTDLWLCDIDGAGARQLTREQATVMSPVWSPDGSRIAFCGAVAEGDAQENLWVLDVNTGHTRMVGDDSLCVADADSVRWTADGAGLLFSQAHRGRHRIVRLDVHDGRLTPMVEGDMQFGAVGAGGGWFAYSGEQPGRPSELYACRTDGSGRKQVSDLNAWWRERTRIRAQAREFDVPDGRGGSEKIEGWLLRAEDSHGPLPLLNDVHGGPASYALLDFDTNVFWQVLCSRGWAVLALNAVGSSSYGREFCDRLMGHWGGVDLPQHLAAVRQLQSEGVCDERVAISGKSYGGYLSAWAVGHTSLFRAAVVMAPVGNIETHYGTSDGGYYADPLYMGSGDRFDRALARELSPLKHIEQARTATLFLQGKEDERCPKCQSEELFVSMMRAGETPAELILYPGEGHTFLGEGAPSVREDAAGRIVDWVTRFAGRPDPPAAPPGDREKAAGRQSASAEPRPG
jgi:dipeptidyl aminopeptidase/acylaminoacyl peptidase